jgi:hypothetical protein
VHDAASEEYRWSAIVMGIVKNPNFLTRTGTASAGN